MDKDHLFILNINKEYVVYYSALRLKEILQFVTTWMNLEGIMVSEIYQIKKDKHCMLSLTCGNEKSLTHRHRELNDGYQGLWDRGNGETLVKRYKLSVVR